MMMKQAEKKQHKIYFVYTLYTICEPKTQLYFCTLSCNLKRIIIIFLPKISSKKYKPVLCNASLSPFRNSKYSSHFLFNFFLLVFQWWHEFKQAWQFFYVPKITLHYYCTSNNWTQQKNKATLFTIKSSHNVFFFKIHLFLIALHHDDVMHACKFNI